MNKKTVRDLFFYLSGDLYWRRAQGNKVKAGDLAGCVTNIGYRIIYIKGRPYRAHRLVFLYHYGYLPKYIDHIDRNPGNNRIENLREVNHRQNMCNSSSSGVSIYKGVSWSKSAKKWQACCKHKGKQYHVGYFNDEQEAAKAWDRWIMLNFSFEDLEFVTFNQSIIKEC